MLNINYIRRGKPWRKGERVSWKLRETRVRGVRKGVASGDGKRWDAETWPKTFENRRVTHTHHPEARGGELRNRLGSLYRALCQKERVEKSTTAF